MTDEPRKVDALDSVIAKPDVVYLSLVIDGESVMFELAPKTAEDVVHTIADALTQLRQLGADQEAGVALYEATKFEGRLESVPGSLGLQQKFVLTAHAQGATKITLRLDPSKVDDLLVDLEQRSTRKRKATKQ